MKKTPVLCLILAALCVSHTGFAQPASNQIEFEKCVLSLPGTTLTAGARCGTLTVAENPAEPDGDTIELNVAIVAAVSKDPQPDPLFLFAGGPGQAATESYVLMRSYLRKLNRTRDIVLIDQRGTGQSNPLKCEAEEAELDTTIDLEKMSQQVRDCLAAVEGDPRFYTTTIGMQDYDLVREAMGYEQINLLGVSYGTRSAQSYMRQFPDRVRTAVLDSVVPPQLLLGTEHAMMLDRSVETVLADCASDEACSEHFSISKADLDGLLGRLRETPQEVTVSDPVTGEPVTFTANADVLAVAIRFLSYASATQAMLPLLLDEAIDEGSLERLSSQAMMVMSGLNDQLSHGMELSVICSEDYPFMEAGTSNENTILGDVFQQVLETQCEIWPQGEVPADFHQPVSLDIPVLLMSGERDPVTPPVYGDQAAEQFSNSLHLVAKGQGHNVVIDQCMLGIAEAFIESGTVDDLDIECVANIQPSPFFLSLLGPNP